jgi:hypothetical protein
VANETNSPQESVLKEFADHSLAAEFVFAPSISRRTKNEPADLVWACNNCVILMYMTRRKDHPGADKKARVLRKAIRHNIGQAGRWLREWKRELYLTGSNKYHAFSLKYHPKCHIIVLSVIQCGDAVAAFHDEDARRFGVRACVTLPQSAIEYVARAGGTALDLVHILDHLRQLRGGSEVQESEVLDLVYSYIQAMCRQVGLDAHWPGHRLDDRFLEAAAPLLMVRRRKSLEQPSGTALQWVGMDDLKDVFNDIHIGEFLHLSIGIRQGIDRTRDDPKYSETVLCAVARLNIYDFRMCFAYGISDVVNAQIDQEIAAWEQQVRDGTMRFGPTLLVDTKDNGFRFHLGQIVGPSQTEKVLNEWAARK